MDEKQVTIESVFSYCVFSEAAGYRVTRYREKSTNRLFTAVGTDLPDRKGLTYLLTGVWERSKDGKKQLKVVYAEKACPDGLEEVTAYFSALRCGVGKYKAKKLYDAFGQELWNVIENSPERLKEVRGIDGAVYDRVLKAVSTDRAMRELSALFGKAGFSASAACLGALKNKFGDNAGAAVKLNPYLAYSAGLPFEKCEALGAYLGLPKEFNGRLETIALRILDSRQMQGHAAAPLRELLQTLMKSSGCAEESCRNALLRLFENGAIKSTSGIVFRTEAYLAETGIVKQIERLYKSAPDSVSCLDAIITAYETENGICLAENQKEAVRKLFSTPVSVITGGPGVGKTTVTKAILYVHRAVYGFDSAPLLLAPTGKAARRMSEATGAAASTIHSAIGWRGEAAGAGPAALKGNLILVDEASMMDQQITCEMLKRTGNGTRVVFIGDTDQLPSVGAGNVLHDLIASGVIPVTRLSVIFRQSEKNPIAVNAHRINCGRTDLIEGTNFRIFETPDTETLFRTAVKLYVGLARKYGPDSVVLLNPQRNNTSVSVERFNREIQLALNPAKEGDRSICAGLTEYRAGDRIMELKNTESARNGDVGVIQEICFRPDTSDKERVIQYAKIEFNCDGIPLEYPKEEFSHLCHAWCMTVHKSQGSEYRTVLQIVTREHSALLHRNLIYTGITRARENCAIIGERDAVNAAIASVDSTVRCTLLAPRLRKQLIQYYKKENDTE